MNLQAFYDQLESAPIASASFLSEQAGVLGREFARVLSEAVAGISGKHHLSPAEAYEICISAGQNSEEAGEVLDRLFELRRLHALPNREFTIMMLASFGLWEKEPFAEKIVNPFESTVQLVILGYWCSIEEAPGEDGETGQPEAVLVGWKNEGELVSERFSL